MRTQFQFKKTVVFFIAASFTFRAGLLAQPPDGQWNPVADAQGKITKMTITTPSTKAGIEREIAVFIDKDGNPIRGDVTFTDGIKRDLKPLEAAFYWSDLKGARALWMYLGAHGRLTVYTPKTVALPIDAFGKQSRILTDDNREFIGKLSAVPTNPDWFVLEVEGSSLNVYKGIIREVQQMK